MNKAILLLFVLQHITSLSAQDRWEASDYRNDNWHPEEGKYFFSEEWTYSFENENLAQDDKHRKGSMSFYVDPPSGTILLTREANSYDDEMTEWILVFTDGRYVMGAINEMGKREVTIMQMQQLSNYEEMLEMHKDDYQQLVKKGYGSLDFGVNKYGWPTINGKQYAKSYTKSHLVTELYMAQVPFSMRALYLVNLINPELNFLINAKYGYLLPESMMILSEKTDIYGKQVFIQLESMSPTSHFLDTQGYGMDH